ncbi:IclR family transcriptional regulator [Leekyejoonella antrihumi]|uniref:IclR family transcriptional regulator n=1 Tax=Leekyejoonella antrihumi TaxID=1660198 RepID=A0A563E0J1_9MICO|nr:IclR family transcriptional regulator [Leekyejoonella antrihumi]TWP36037.1 IclR family transcriptional regulator [Leekyejoonella antrihumi]
MSASHDDLTALSNIDGDTPTLRLFALLELICSKDEFVSLQGLVAETGLPKPTVHRMLGQLESGGFLVRQNDGRLYGTGVRLRRLAENILINATQHGARHAILKHLVDQVGESCNVTALSGNEVVYLDRVETSEPLRFYLHAGSRVPVHASASGKMILSQLPVSQRHKLLAHAPLSSHTEATITGLEALEAELDRTRERGYALDDEEYLPGLVCFAVLVPAEHGRSNLCVAAQAPALRMSADNADDVLPALREAAAALAEVEHEGSVSTEQETSA